MQKITKTALKAQLAQNKLEEPVLIVGKKDIVEGIAIPLLFYDALKIDLEFHKDSGSTYAITLSGIDSFWLNYLRSNSEYKAMRLVYKNTNRCYLIAPKWQSNIEAIINLIAKINAQ